MPLPSATSRPTPVATLLHLLVLGLVSASASVAEDARPAVIRARSARSLALEADRLARDRGLLRLTAGDWDPIDDPKARPGLPALSGPLRELVPQSLADENVRYWIVQEAATDGALGRALERDAGLEVVGRVPNAAWLVRARGDASGRLGHLPGVRWCGEWSPDVKPSPRLARLHEGEEPPPGAVDPAGLRVHVRFHRGASASPWVPVLESVRGLSVRGLRDDPEAGSEVLVALALPRWREGLVDLARMRDVASLSLDERPHPTNDNQSIALQSGLDPRMVDHDLGARLFALGIQGQGLQVAMVGDGLENDLAAFRYTEAVDDAAWNVGDDGSLAVEGGDLASPRTRLRKVTAYLVFDGASPYSSPNQHLTGMASITVGDAGGFAGGALAARPLIRDLGSGQNLASCETGGVGWSPGDLLRDDIAAFVDDPALAEPAFGSDFGALVQHHDALDGVAPGAQLVVMDIGNASGSLTGVLFGYQAVDLARHHGATVQAQGYGGAPCDDCYTGSAPGTDFGVWKHRMLLPVVSAGNSGNLGTSTINAGTAQAKGVIVVGATEAADASSGAPAVRPGENLASYTSRGPKSGGALAPELVSPGAVRFMSSPGVTPEDGSGSGDPLDGTPEWGNGTSFAAAAIAGAATLVQQYFLDGWYPTGRPVPTDALRPTNALVRAVLANSTRNLGGLRTGDDPTARGDRPNFGQGWGRPVLDDTLYFEGDPLRGIDPVGDTQRAGLLVLTDTPNGVTPGATLTEEPGGLPRDGIVASFRPAIRHQRIEEFLIEVQNPAPGDPAHELRVTLAWADVDGPSPLGRTLVNDLDLELIDPRGVVYRSRPLTAWEAGFTRPATVQEAQEFLPFTGYTDFPDRDASNTLENVFVRSEDVEPGTWRVRIIGYDVPGNGRTANDATPNFVAGDNPPDRDLSDPCDGVPDVDSRDAIDSRDQGYALIVSGGVGRERLPCQPLRLPGELTVTASAGACGLDVSWSAAEGAAPPVRHEVYRSDSLPVPLDAAHLVAAGVAGTTWTDEATGGLPWSYRVVAIDSCTDPGPRRAANEGGDSPLFAIPAPSFPGDVEAVLLPEACGIRVSWPAATAAGPITYDVYRDEASPVPLDAAHLVGTVVGETELLDSPPTARPWHYRVVAQESCADPAPRRVANEGGDSESVAIPRLALPGEVTVTPEVCAVRLSWQTAGGHGPITYDVHRDEAAPVDLGPATLVAEGLTATTWLDEGWHGEDRRYRVVARDLCGEAANLGGDSESVTPIDVTPPSFGGVVDTRDLGYCEVEVSWDDSTAADECSGIAGFNVYRDNGVGRRGRTLVASGVPASPFIDTTPGNGTWVYVVRAVDGAGNEEQNDVFQQESENSCTNDFPEDAGMDDENGVDPPNADEGNGFAPAPGDDLAGRLEARIERSLGGWLTNESLRIAWNPSPDEGGLYPISYSVLRGDLVTLADAGYAYALATPESCGLTAHETELAGQVDGGSYYYVVVPVSGDNATFGYDHRGLERPEAAVCE